MSTRVEALDPDGAVARALAERYHLAARIGPYPVYRLGPALPERPPVA